jgi:hypothetical protein
MLRDVFELKEIVKGGFEEINKKYLGGLFIDTRLLSALIH